eukprot:Hpha_TRINITY_DN15876_c0_g3::TRINITY_DN15876_c0_g3_i13::g.190949::m.190949
MEYKRVLNVVKGKMCGQPWATVQAKAKEIYNKGNVLEEQLKNLKNPRLPGTGILTFFRPATKAEAALVAAGLVATVSGAAPPLRTPHLTSGCAAAVLVVACAAGEERGLMETMRRLKKLCDQESAAPEEVEYRSAVDAFWDPAVAFAAFSVQYLAVVGSRTGGIRGQRCWRSVIADIEASADNIAATVPCAAALAALDRVNHKSPRERPSVVP